MANSWNGESTSHRFVNSINDQSYIAELEINQGGKLTIFFTNNNSKECTKYSKESFDAGVSYINRQAVKIKKQCLAKNVITYFAGTENGREFIINQFKKSNTVIYSKIEFTAKGFTKAFSELDTPFNKPI